ncbi:MAG: GGDEF domain-containing protein [Candidatus Paceibacterota bacterium]|jgi:diguanylate cyclase (GGDEF)-like protein
MEKTFQKQKDDPLEPENTLEEVKVGMREMVEETRAKIEKLETENEELRNIIENLDHRLHIDSLTGLLKDVEPRLGRLIKRLEFSKELKPEQSALRAIVIVAIDLNRFKFLNDTHGHAAGDEALVLFAERLQAVSREGKNILFRPHGDEFVMILPIENTEEAITPEIYETIFQRLQKEVNDNLFVKVPDGTNFLFSASMGYAVLKRGESKTTTELLHEADLEMYKNKEKRKEKNA